MNKQAEQLLQQYWHEKGVPMGKEFPTREEVVAHCLVRWAETISLLPCSDSKTCEGCNIDFSIWWDWLGTLSPPTRIAVQKIMRQCAIPLPPGPWEEVASIAVPSAFN